MFRWSLAHSMLANNHCFIFKERQICLPYLFKQSFFIVSRVLQSNISHNEKDFRILVVCNLKFHYYADFCKACSTSTAFQQIWKVTCIIGSLDCWFWQKHILCKNLFHTYVLIYPTVHIRRAHFINLDCMKQN